MVAAEPEVISQAKMNSSADHNKEESSNHGGCEPHNNGGNNNNSSSAFPHLGRQSSIYSLTLDEFQHTLCDNGKNFGSMNMDEFLNSIWTAEENQGHHQNQQYNDHHHNNSSSVQVLSSVMDTNLKDRGTMAKQPSLPRQGSLSLPAPLCRKTVDEVWSEIQRSQQQQQHTQQHENSSQQQLDVGNSNSTQRQSTFGEMTLEDFLIKAGVVREQCGPHQSLAPPVQHPHSHPHPHHHPNPNQYGFTNPSHRQMGPGSAFVGRPMIGGPYQAIPASVGGESSGYSGNGKRNNGYTTTAASVACYGGRVSNNGGAPGGGFVAPVSPVSPDGICGPGQVDNSGVGQYGMDMAALRGRKRMIDGPVEMVVERRQRRMIKNRESAARSRARKQAYTVELEAELNQLREENAQLKHALAEVERHGKQQYVEEQRLVEPTRAQRAQEKLKTMRKSRCYTL